MTGTPLIRSRSSSCATSCTRASGEVVYTLCVIISLANIPHAAFQLYMIAVKTSYINHTTSSAFCYKYNGATGLTISFWDDGAASCRVMLLKRMPVRASPLLYPDLSPTFGTSPFDAQVNYRALFA